MRTLTFRRSVAPITLAAMLLAAFVFLFASPQPAAAHDVLVDSTPAADSTVDTLPTELTLTFSAGLIGGDGSTEVVVLDAAGDNVADGAAKVDGAMVTQPLAAEAAAGEYHVLWKVVSSDGHPTSGQFSFTVAGDTTPTTTPAPDPSADETVAPAPSQTQTAVPLDDSNMESEASFSPVWIILGAVIVVIIVFVVLMLLRRRRSPKPESDAPAER